MKNKSSSSGANAIPEPFSGYIRCAGILLHITSLPSKFGIGDFGETARSFAQFLQRTEQTVWQILPINSASSAQGFSPYGSDGSFGGNTLLISPEMLVKDGLLPAEYIAQIEAKTKRIDYKKVEEIKATLLDEAYENFNKNKPAFEEPFLSFCKEEQHWLDDYALYQTIKKEQQNKAWNEWDNALKHRDANALESFAGKHSAEIEKIKWQQLIFHKQWFELKRYCNDLGIKIFGDLPFYVAFDSADVWAHQHLFQLDAEGNMTVESGAPPDDFNADGQRWGMPVYNWNESKKEGYKWWLNRMKKNIKTFDLLRLDHFRGFSAYWQIPVNAKSAKEGEWEKGPGEALFTLLQNEIGSLPLVAEDLGTIDEPVIKLRNQFGIPGMIIQQVAFGDDMPQSKSIPHHHYKNCVVYTGNHDNNTTLGWFKSLPEKLANNVSLYTNRSVTKHNVVAVLSHLIYASVAKLAVLPMQDILELDEEARMNSVPNGEASWSWKMKEDWLTEKIEKRLQDLCFVYDRKRKV